MALVKKSETTAAAPVQFEETGAEDGEATETVVKEAEVKKAKPETAKATTAMTTKREMPVALKGPTATDFDYLGQLENRMGFPEWGEDTRLVPSNGAIKDGDGGKYGTEIMLNIISWNYHWVVSPGESGNAAAKRVRHSADGETILEGGDIQEYLAELKEDYPKAAIKKYIDVFGILMKCEANKDAELSPVLLSVSPTGVKAFGKHKKSLMTKAMFGLIDQPDLERGLSTRVTVDVKEKNDVEWTQFEFSMPDATS